MYEPGRSDMNGPAASFTPINQGQPSLHSISPLRTLHRKAIDSDNLYDIPPDTEESSTPPKKQGASQRGNVRSVSLAQVWAYNEDQLTGEVFEGEHVPPPKRRKKAPLKRAKTTRPILEHDEVDATQEQRSQLTTPPNSSKRSRRKSFSTSVSKKSKVADVFHNAVITKPLVGRSKQDTHEEAHQPSLSSLRGFKTTEEKLKRYPVGLTRTTLDKLAAFRFQPKPSDDMETQDVAIRQDEVVLEEIPHQSSDDEHHSSTGSFFQEAMWEKNTESHSSPTIQEREHDINDRGMFSGNPTSIETRQHAPIHSQNTRTTPIHPRSEQLIPHTETSTIDQNYCQTDAEHEQLMSSKMEKGKYTGVKAIVENEKPLSTSHNDSLDPPLNPKIVLAPNRASKQADDGPKSLPSTNTKSTVHSSLGAPSEPVDGCLLASDHANVLGIDDSDIELFRGTQSKDRITIDEFNDGLEDDDLLALVSNPLATTQSGKDMLQRNNGGNSAHPCLSEQEGSCQEVLKTDYRTEPTPNDPIPLKHASSSKLPESTLDEDQYPIDDMDEEQLCDLVDIASGEERHAPPASLQFPFDDESVTREVYDSSLQFSPPKSLGTNIAEEAAADNNATNASSPQTATRIQDHGILPIDVEEDWSFIHTDDDVEGSHVNMPHSSDKGPVRCDPLEKRTTTALVDVNGNSLAIHMSSTRSTNTDTWILLDDSHEYAPLKPFARPKFPAPTQDRSPITGLSPQMFLRTCFRIGEMIKEGARCNALKQDAIIELFARVTFSSREPNSSKQHFQFADLFHDRPPFPNGILANYKSSGLAESESKVFIEREGELMTRCLGRLKRDCRNDCWVLHILQIRETDWEEIKWTKRVVSGDGLNKEQDKSTL